MNSKAFIFVALLCIGTAQLASAWDCGDPCEHGACQHGWCNHNNVCECGGVHGDPELEGLDGRRFLFDGEANKSFNLITEENHQLNAFFVEGPHQMSAPGSGETHNGTWVGSFGFKVYGQKVQIDTDDNGDMTVAINDKKVELNEANNFQDIQSFDNLNVTTNKYRKGFGESVRIESDIYILFVHATPRAWDLFTNQMNRGHLNLGLAVKPEAYFKRAVHGVLGQITPETHPDVSALPKELQTAFLGEGEQNDYMVSDLFADDFKFNLYGKPQPINIKTAVSRRLLTTRATGQESVKLGFLGSEKVLSMM